MKLSIDVTEEWHSADVQVTSKPRKVRSQAEIVPPLTFEFTNVPPKEMSFAVTVSNAVIRLDDAPWTDLTGALQQTTQDAARSLQVLVSQIKQLSLAERSPHLVELAHAALEELQKRKGENIDEWARRLAQDVGGASD